MKCDVLKFDFTKTWIFLTAGKKNDDYRLEYRIINSIWNYVNLFEPDNVDHDYGRVTEILLFEDINEIASIKGIGAKAINRINDVREYLHSKKSYCWIFGEDIEYDKIKMEDNQMISFGDLDNKKSQKKHREYVLTVNGFKTNDIKYALRDTDKYTLNLSDEEYRGIEKLFEAIGSKFASITGMGVSAL